MAMPGRLCCIALVALVNLPACTEGLQAVVSQPAQVWPAGNLTMEVEEDQETSNRTTAAVFSDLLKSADELRRQIEDAEKAHGKKVRDHEDSLKATLEEMRANATRMEDQNQQLRGEIQVLRVNNDKLFAHAKQLKLEDTLWRDDWKELEQNVSLAVEVAQKSWDEVNDSLSAEDMDIIREMNQLAWNDELTRYRSDLMKTLGGDGDVLSLLALKGPEMRRSRIASDTVSILDDELHDMAEATAAQLNSLDEKYSYLFSQQAARVETIVRDHANLVVSKQSEMKLQDKLQVAVEELQELKETNEKKGYLVRQFAQELGLNALPTSGTIGEDWDNLLDLEASQQQRLGVGNTDVQDVASEFIKAVEEDNVGDAKKTYANLLKQTGIKKMLETPPKKKTRMMTVGTTIAGIDM